MGHPDGTKYYDGCYSTLDFLARPLARRPGLLLGHAYGIFIYCFVQKYQLLQFFH